MYMSLRKPKGFTTIASHLTRKYLLHNGGCPITSTTPLKHHWIHSEAVVAPLPQSLHTQFTPWRTSSVTSSHENTNPCRPPSGVALFARYACFCLRGPVYIIFTRRSTHFRGSHVPSRGHRLRVSLYRTMLMNARMSML